MTSRAIPLLPMNGQSPTEPKKKTADDFSIRLSTIRIWMHEKDIGKLTKVLWAGQGNRLRQQASTNPKVKRFLAAVPYVMNTIKDVHQSVVDNNLETLQATMEPPVPQALITCKDSNGLNVIHKAAGLGHTMILEYLLNLWPEGANETDMTGKTPLHWAASAKNNMRCYTLLTQAGCEEDALDYKMKTPAYYKQKHNEVERSFLTLVPDAPRVSQDIPTDWEALVGDEGEKKSEPKSTNGRRTSDLLGNGMNLLTSRSEANSIENTSEPDYFQGENGNEEPPDPLEPEVEAIEVDDTILENGNSTEQDAENTGSDPTSPPETPDDGNHNENQEKAQEQPEHAQEEENVSNALNDQNNNESMGNEDVDDKDEETVDGGNFEDTDGDKQEEDTVEKNEVDTEEVNENEDKEDNIEENGSNKNDNENNDEDKTDDENVDNGDNKEQPEKTDEDNKEEVAEEAVEENNESEDENKSEVNLVEEENDTNDVQEEPQELGEESKSTSGDPEPNDSQTNSDENQEDEKNKSKEDEEKKSEEDGENKSKEDEEKKSEEDEENKSDEEEDSKKVKSLENNKENDEDDDDQAVTFESHEAKEDENNDYDEKTSIDSPTSSLAIEGFVRGDSEDNQVQSESAAYLNDEEEYIESVIKSGDMEQLAALVLNGDGKKILNRKSSQPEIQAFLKNVPAYMNKISRVHEAARQGSLYQLQAALDRRKFAIAKDEISPCGASPLHVAVLFGHSDIVRYLAGRFPETTSAVDDDGRTPLHYAATVNDNGHFFNLLTHLGGNPKATDKFGNTAEFYTNKEEAKDVLTYKQLLKRFGAEALEDEILSDQGSAENHSQNAIFKTEQGKYLASSLGDPLIKGLTEIAEKRPTDPVAYLAGFLQNFLKSRKNIRENDTRDSNSTALANSDNEIISSPKQLNGNDSPLTEDHIISSPESTPKNEDRDEHGQSMLHFACARSHRRNGLLNLIEESQIDITYRDELYRTARDVSLQASQPGNAKEIDRYVLSLAVVGDVKPFENMAIAGYDHILDVVDEEGVSITDVAESRGHEKLVEFLNELRNLEESREELHEATRNGDFEKVKEITSTRKGKWLIKAKNYYGRSAMHIAVLKELEDIVEYFVNTCPDALKVGDNLERTPLHYAMGTNSVESVSRVLIRKGAKRTTKDLKGRQPSYYFINKADILRLQEEEDEHR